MGNRFTMRQTTEGYWQFWCELLGYGKCVTVRTKLTRAQAREVRKAMNDAHAIGAQSKADEIREAIRWREP